jgi:hypothetical protein
MLARVNYTTLDRLIKPLERDEVGKGVVRAPSNVISVAEGERIVFPK